MLKSGAHVIKDNSKKIFAALDDLGRKRVMVGIPAENAGRTDGPINNAAIAYIQTFGAPEVNIPPRPFLVPGLQAIKPKIEAGLRKTGEAALTGNPQNVDKGLHAVGLLAQAAVRAKIESGPFAPLAASTLAARRRRGRTGTKPLIDTSQLLHAITYVIRKLAGK